MLHTREIVYQGRLSSNYLLYIFCWIDGSEKWCRHEAVYSRLSTEHVLLTRVIHYVVSHEIKLISQIYLGCFASFIDVLFQHLRGNFPEAYLSTKNPRYQVSLSRFPDV